jgi:hypothetical protein
MRSLSDAIAETRDDPISIVDTCTALISWTLGSPSSFDGNDLSICYFAFGVTPMIISFVNAINYWLINEDPTPDQLAAAKQFANNCYNAQGTYGTGNMMVAIYNAFENQPSSTAQIGS